MVFLPNPPVEDAAGGEADKSLRPPCEMLAQLNLHLIFNRGGAYFSGRQTRKSLSLGLIKIIKNYNSSLHPNILPKLSVSNF
jgi:hypothetical protein